MEYYIPPCFLVTSKLCARSIYKSLTVGQCINTERNYSGISELLMPQPYSLHLLYMSERIVYFVVKLL